jgi:hypothetical protein
METPHVRAAMVAIVILPNVCVWGGPKKGFLYRSSASPPGSKSANYGTQACLLIAYCLEQALADFEEMCQWIKSDA